ncbi:hypothetical protein ACF08B_41405 [Streptomyces sp. NPDC015139]|uniref:hypothetical protein n=1 Tax=Streptomyces sp. NPDC015139 TaxID=3364942 RepID=UPI0036F5DCC2
MPFASTVRERCHPEGHNFEESPVYGYETFRVQVLDMWGRVGLGQCVVVQVQSPGR